VIATGGEWDPQMECRKNGRHQTTVTFNFALIGASLSKPIIIGANFKTFQFGRGQGGRKFQPEEYTEYFED
jgi:hypothetical protein